MHILHLDYAKLAKKRGGIDRARFAFGKSCRGNDTELIKFLSQKAFKDVKCLISDKAKVFESKKTSRVG